MHVKFLGTGGVFDYEYGNSAAVVRHNGRTILIDCGPSVYGTLCSHGLIEEIDYIVLTHLHGDHVGSLFSLLIHLSSRCKPSRKAVLLYPTDQFRQLVESFLKHWFPDVSAYIHFKPMSTVEGVGFIETTGKHIAGILSFAYYFTEGADLIYYSGDLGDVEVTADFLRSRHETQITVFHELHYNRGKAHTFYRDVMESLQGYSVYGYHVDPTKVPADNTVPLVARTPELLL